jgi:hypothetical protein
VSDFLKIIKFYKGVSGFMDVTDSCRKYNNLAVRLNRKECQAIASEHSEVGSPVGDSMRDLDDVLEVYKGWRKIFNRPPPNRVCSMRKT